MIITVEEVRKQFKGRTEDEIEIIEDGLTFHESLISEVLQRDSEMYEAALSSNKIASNAIMSIATDNGKAAISIFENALDKKFVKPENHRALDDINGSIEELKWYLTFLK